MKQYKITIRGTDTLCQIAQGSDEYEAFFNMIAVKCPEWRMDYTKKQMLKHMKEYDIVELAA